jgi:hypothetical protein
MKPGVSHDRTEENSLIVRLVSALALVLITAPAQALHPMAIFDYCKPLQNQGNLASNLKQTKRMERGVAYLAAVIDSLRAEGAPCDVEPGFDACLRYRDFVQVHGAPGKNAFPIARRAMTEAYNCR